MKQEHSIQRRRLFVVSLAFLFMATFLGLRLVQKTVFEHATYTALAKGQQFKQKELQGKRGQILVRDGVGNKTYPVVTNQTMYALNAVPSQIIDKRKVADELAKAVELDPDGLYDQINNSKLYIPPLKHKLTFEESERIDNLKLEGVYITPEEARFYPEDGLAAQVLGFVNADGKGQYGIEAFFDDMLRGRSGRQEDARDSNGQPVALGGSSLEAPRDGSNIVLTIDRNVQYQAEQALEEAIKKHSATGGSIIIMEPQTGAIRAMVSRPTYDPNRFSVAKPESYVNQAVAGTYEPGSTFKTIAMAAGLDSGAVTPNTIINGTASIKVGDREIFNSARTPYGRETMTQVIERSDNVGMVHVAQALGGQRLYDYIERFGFGTPIGIELDGEAAPNLTPIDELGEVNFATMAFGQGISVTPLQLITGVNAIANQGKLVQPRIIEQIQHPDGKVEATQVKTVRQVISPTAASQMSGMMVRVVEAGAGKPAAVSGYRIAGKTGTAQIASGGGYEEGTSIGNFIGFAPVDQPRFIMLVKVDRPKGVVFAEESAAPTFGTIANFLLKYYNVPPGH